MDRRGLLRFMGVSAASAIVAPKLLLPAARQIAAQDPQRRLFLPPSGGWFGWRAEETAADYLRRLNTIDSILIADGAPAITRLTIGNASSQTVTVSIDTAGDDFPIDGDPSWTPLLAYHVPGHVSLLDRAQVPYPTKPFIRARMQGRGEVAITALTSDGRALYWLLRG